MQGAEQTPCSTPTQEGTRKVLECFTQGKSINNTATQTYTLLQVKVLNSKCTCAEVQKNWYQNVFTVKNQK